MLVGKGLKPLGRNSLLLLGLAQGTTCLGCVYAMLGLPGLPPCTGEYYTGWLFQPSVQSCLDFDWAVMTMTMTMVTTCLGIIHDFGNQTAVPQAWS